VDNDDDANDDDDEIADMMNGLENGEGASVGVAAGTEGERAHVAVADGGGGDDPGRHRRPRRHLCRRRPSPPSRYRRLIMLAGRRRRRGTHFRLNAPAASEVHKHMLPSAPGPQERACHNIGPSLLVLCETHR